jgi:UDP-glucose 4-epimerase
MPCQTILVTGGAGYIGSHAVLAFLEAGYPVVVLDDLSTGRCAAVPGDVTLIEGDAGDGALVGETIRGHGIGAIVHFAGGVVVSESVADPLKYYRNNCCVSQNIIQACVEGGVGTFIYSSSAAVYGVPDSMPVAEGAVTRLISPYGITKLVTEWMLRDTAAAHDFRYAVQRCFNVARTNPGGRAGESTPIANHLVKAACEAAVGRGEYKVVWRRLRHAGRYLCTRLRPCDRPCGAHLDPLRYLWMVGMTTQF